MVSRWIENTGETDGFACGSMERMFGYVRPQKADLRMREFTRYRAVYCGLCKTLASRYGQVPRLAVTYDLTFFALLLLSLSNSDDQLVREVCILNPVQKKLVAKDHPVLDFTADVTVLLAGHAAADDVGDDGGLKARAQAGLLKGHVKKATSLRPELAAAIAAALAALTAKEASATPWPVADLARAFGEVLRIVFLQSLPLLELTAPFADAFGLIGADLGAWIYLIDALDDFREDKARGRFNALGGTDRDAAVAAVVPYLVEVEASLDRTLALMPYRKDGGIVQNIVLGGLPEVRAAVTAGRPLARV